MEELKIKSQYDGLELGVTICVPPKQSPRGIIQLSHGMCEHRTRYYDLMNFLAEAGYVAIIHDHRGHGDSVRRSPDDLGYFYRNGVVGLVEDLHQITQYIKQCFPQLLLVLLGHSMGSMVVRCYTQQYDADLDGLVVCGSPSHNAGAGAALQLVRLMKALRGERHRSKFLQRATFGSYNKHIPQPSSPNSWICSDPAVVRAYDQDPECNFIFTVNGFETLFRLMRQTYRKQGWAMAKPELPVLFIAGAEDPCIRNREAFEQAVDFMRARGYRNVESILYPEMRHEILNEIHKDKVWRDLVNWLEENRSQAAR